MISSAPWSSSSEEYSDEDRTDSSDSETPLLPAAPLGMVPAGSPVRDPATGRLCQPYRPAPRPPTFRPDLEVEAMPIGAHPRLQQLQPRSVLRGPRPDSQRRTEPLPPSDPARDPSREQMARAVRSSVEAAFFARGGAGADRKGAGSCG